MEVTMMELLTNTLEQQLKTLIITTLYDSSIHLHKEWMSISEAAKYAGVSYNTFSKFRTMGLKICEIDGIKRVSKKELDTFLETYSY